MAEAVNTTEQLVENGDAPDGLPEGTRLSDEQRDTLASKIGGALDSVQIEDEDGLLDEDVDADEQTDGADEAEAEAEEEDEPRRGPSTDPDEEPEGDPDQTISAAGDGKDTETQEDDDQGAASDDDAEPTLSEAQRRSAYARGWTDSEIDAYVRSDRESALNRFERIHLERNAEIQEYARLGRQLKESEKGAVQSPQTATQPTARAEQGTTLQPLDAQALATQHGADEELVSAIVGPVNEAIATLNAVMPDLTDGIEKVRKTEYDALATQIDQFFSAPALKPYEQIYGTPGNRTVDQNDTWQATLELADSIRAGALYQGRNLSVEDALDAAHSSISSKFNIETARAEIKTKTKKRSASVSLKPNKAGSQSVARKETAGNRTRADLIADVDRGLTLAFAGSDES